MSFRIPTLFLIFSFLCSPIYGQQEFFPFLAEVTAKNIHVRSGQSANFESLCQLKQGEEVVVLEKKYSWYKVQLPTSSQSYIHGKFVTLLKKNLGEISGDRVNIRAGMGINYSILGQLNKGDKVVILEPVNDWYKIVPSEKTFGWIKDHLIVFKSKDIAEYQSQMARIFEEESKQEFKFDLKLEPEPEVVIKEKKPMIEPVYEEPIIEKTEPLILVTGVLQLQQNNFEKSAYRLVINGQPTYYLKGNRYIFDDFLNYTVTISGKKDVDSFFQTVHPILKVSKIELVL